VIETSPKMYPKLVFPDTGLPRSFRASFRVKVVLNGNSKEMDSPFPTMNVMFNYSAMGPLITFMG
jgi:hypothetical protein